MSLLKKPTIKQDDTPRVETLPPFDFDRYCGRVLIVSQDRSRFEQAAEFLSDRHWSTTLCSNLNDFIRALSRRMPDFLFFAIDSPDSLLMEAIQWLPLDPNVSVVGFCERVNAESEQKLNENTFVKYKMFKNASGPTFSLELRKILYAWHTDSSSTKTTLNLLESLARFQRKGNGSKDVPVQNRSSGARIISRQSQSQNSKIPSLSPTFEIRPLKDTLNVALGGLVFPDHIPQGSLTRIISLEVSPLFSQEAKGYLLFATNYLNGVNKPLFSSYKGLLIRQAAGTISPVLLGPEFTIQTGEFDFLQWSQAQTESLAHQVKSGSEAATCFLQVASPPLPKQPTPNADGKLALDTNDFPIDQVLTFATYIYLKENKRYMPYLKMGSILTASQKEKLIHSNQILYIDLQDSYAFINLYVQHSLKDQLRLAT